VSNSFFVAKITKIFGLNGAVASKEYHQSEKRIEWLNISFLLKI
jgi:hypothetical protein